MLPELGITNNCGQNLLMLSCNHRADVLSADGALHVAGLMEVENDDGHAVALTQIHRADIHHREAFIDDAIIAEFRIEFGVRVFMRIGAVDAVDLSGLEQGIGADFNGGQGGGGIRGDKGAARAAGENDHPAGVQQFHAAVPVKRFANGGDRQIGQYPGFHAGRLERLAQGQGVNESGQHPHLVSSGFRNMGIAGESGATNDISPTDDDGHLNIQGQDLSHLAGDVCQSIAAKSEALRGG